MELSERLNDIIDKIMREGVHSVGLHTMTNLVAEVAQLEYDLTIEKQCSAFATTCMRKDQEKVTQLEAERNAFILMYQMSVHPVDVPHEEVVEAHRIVKEFFKAEDEKS